jgi:hypothetical protein
MVAEIYVRVEKHDLLAMLDLMVLFICSIFSSLEFEELNGLVPVFCQV